jgi:hypothetical protein
MYKFNIIFSLLLIVILIPACEQATDESEFPYEAKLVIRGLIQEGEPINNIYIARTLPVPVKYQQKFAEINNASVGILTKDTLIALKYLNNSIYTTNGYIPKKGEKLTLIVQWEDKLATAETIIPNIGLISEPSLKSVNDNNKIKLFIESIVLPYSKEVYGATWVTYYDNGAISKEGEDFLSIFKSGTIPGQQNINVSTMELPSNVSATANLGVRIHVYPPDFYDYFITQSSSKLSENIFSQSNANVRWNIKGDGIGMFIAKTDTLIKLKKQN